MAVHGSTCSILLRLLSLQSDTSTDVENLLRGDPRLRRRSAERMRFHQSGAGLNVQSAEHDFWACFVDVLLGVPAQT